MVIEVLRAAGTIYDGQLHSFEGALALVSCRAAPGGGTEIVLSLSYDGGRSWTGARHLGFCLDPASLWSGLDGAFLAIAWLAPPQGRREGHRGRVLLCLVTEAGAKVAPAQVVADEVYHIIEGLHGAFVGTRLRLVWARAGCFHVASGDLLVGVFAVRSIETKKSVQHFTALAAHGPGLAVVWGKGGKDDADLYLMHSADGQRFNDAQRLAHDNSDWAFRIPHHSCSRGAGLLVTWVNKAAGGFIVEKASSIACGARPAKGTLRRALKLRGGIRSAWEPQGQTCYVAYPTGSAPHEFELQRSVDGGNQFRTLEIPADWAFEESGSHVTPEIVAFGKRVWALRMGKKSLFAFCWAEGLPQSAFSLPLPLEEKGKKTLLCSLVADEKGVLGLVAAEGEEEGRLFLCRLP